MHVCCGLEKKMTISYGNTLSKSNIKTPHLNTRWRPVLHLQAQKKQVGGAGQSCVQCRRSEHNLWGVSFQPFWWTLRSGENPECHHKPLLLAWRTEDRLFLQYMHKKKYIYIFLIVIIVFPPVTVMSKSSCYVTRHKVCIAFRFYCCEAFTNVNIPILALGLVVSCLASCLNISMAYFESHQ